MVLIGEGRSFKYEFDWSNARIPAFGCGVSESRNRPYKVKSCTIADKSENLPWISAAPSPW
jgi:hypothetical protein